MYTVLVSLHSACIFLTRSLLGRACQGKVEVPDNKVAVCNIYKVVECTPTDSEGAIPAVNLHDIYTSSDCSSVNSLVRK